MQTAFFPIFLFAACVFGLAIFLLAVARLFNPVRPGRIKRMPYESGMTPFHDTRRRFDVRFHLLAIAFMVFDVELLFLYPWAVAMRPATPTTISSTSEGTPLVTESASPAAQIDSKSSQNDSKSFQKVPKISQTSTKTPQTAHPSKATGIDRAIALGWTDHRNTIFIGAMIFILLLTLGFVYDWRKGVFHWK